MNSLKQRGNLFGQVKSVNKINHVTVFFNKWLSPFVGQVLSHDIAAYIWTVNPRYKNTIKHFMFDFEGETPSDPHIVLFNVPDSDRFIAYYKSTISSAGMN